MKKNLVKKAVLPALVALICSVVALTSVSYAWFSMGDQASVDGMQMKVTSADGLQISATGNAGDFKSNLDVAALEAVDTNQFPAEVTPASTGGTVSNGKLSFYTGQISDGKLSSVTATTGAYICFDIYVQVAAGKKLQLDAGSIVAMIAGDSKETHLSSRVAFINLGYAATAADAIGMNNAFVPVNNIKIWEPNALIRSQAYTNAGGSATAAKLDYKGLVDVGTNAEGEVSAENVVTFAPAQDASLKTTEAVDLFDLGAGYNRIRVYIWMEGQDVDCLNAVSGGQFAITLKFAQANK